MNYQIDCMKDMRRGCGRIGAALLIFVVVETIASSVLLWAIEAIVQRPLNSVEYMILNDVSVYLIGGAALWMMLLPLPKAKPRQNQALHFCEAARLSLEAVGVMISVNFLTQIIISYISTILGQEMNNLVDVTLSDMSTDVMFFFVVLIAPVFEEILFRRILLRRLLPFGERFAAAICGLAFGLFHMNLYQFFYAAALGWFFACIVIKTGRLRYTIGLHMLINFTGAVLPTALENYETALNVYYVVLILAALAGVVLLFVYLKTLLPRQPSLYGCWTAAITSPGMLLCVIILLFISLIVTMLI